MQKLLFMGFVIILSVNLAAQTQPIQSEVREIHDPTGVPYTQKIVTIDNQTILSFSQSGYTNQPYIFHRIKIGASTADIAELVNPRFIVKDVKVFGSELFFCGEFGGEGFIARSDFNDLFLNGQFKFDHLEQVRSLDKLEVFANSNGLQIVAIGRAMNLYFSLR